MTAIVRWLIETSVAVAALALVVELFRRPLRQRPAVQHALWLVVLVKFLTPPLVAWPWSLAGLLARPASAIPASATSRRPASPAVEQPLGPPLVSESFGSADSPGSSAARHASTDQASLDRAIARDTAWSAWTAVDVIGAAWLAGCLGAVGVQTRRIVRRRRIVRQGWEAPDELVAAVSAVARQLGLRPVSTVLVPAAAPFVWCLGRARLCWPAALAGAADIQRARAVIAHELAHLRRRDHWIAWLELTAAVLWWFNPLLALVRARLREAAELACDALALGAASADRRAYAELLLAFSADRGSPSAVALGMRAGGRQSFERRLQMILCEQVSTKVTWAGRLLVALAVAIAIPAWRLSAADDEPPRPGTADHDETDTQQPAAANSSEQAADEPTDNQADAAATELLQYDGKSFQWWRDYLQTELKGERRIEAIDAMSAFGVNGRPIEAAEVIIDVWRGAGAGYRNQHDVRSAAGMALQYIGPAASPVLLPALNGRDRELRRSILQILAGYLHSGMAEKADAVRAIIALADDPDADVRIEMLLTIRQEPEAIPVIVRLLKSDPAAAVRANAAAALAASKAPVDSIVPRLIEATSDSNANVRAAALYQLTNSQAVDQAVVFPILIAALDDDGKSVLNVAVKQIARHPSLVKTAVPRLINAFYNIDSDSQRELARALGQIGPEAKEAIPLLKRAILRNEDEGVRKTASRALQQITQSNEED